MSLRSELSFLNLPHEQTDHQNPGFASSEQPDSIALLCRQMGACASSFLDRKLASYRLTALPVNLVGSNRANS
jgi:hypothetical protein